MPSLLNILLATTLTLAVIVPQIESTYNDDDDSCHSYAGGSVYPQGDGRADHKLQYTKAVSKFCILS